MDKAAHLQAVIAAGRRLHEAIDTIDTVLASRLGVHRSDLRCLHLLEQGPASPGEVAAHTRLTSGSVTALVDRLEAAGLVERCRSAADRRCVELAIPAARLIELRAIYSEIEQDVRGHFAERDANDIAESARVLDDIAAALEGFAGRFGDSCG